MKETINKRIVGFLTKYGLILISILVLIIGISSIFITAYFSTTYNTATEVTSFKFSFGIIEIVLAIALVSIVVFTCKKVINKIPNKVLLIVSLVIISLIYVIWIYILKLEPIDDQKKIHEIAIDLIDGKVGLHFVKPMYLFLFPYQLGIVFFVSIFYRIFGQNYLVFEYVNAVFSVINILLMYFISEEIFDKEEVKKYLIILLIFFSVYFMFFNVFFYGNIVGLTFSLGAVLCVLKYLKSSKIFKLVIAGIFTAISIVLKTNYSIFLCGIIVLLSLDVINNFNFKKLFAIIVFLFSYVVVLFSYNFAMEKTYELDIPDGVPMINYIYMGMSDNIALYPGWYNSDTLNIYYKNNLDNNESKKEAKSLIKKRVGDFYRNPKECLSYYSKKIGSTWLNPTFQTIWCSTPGARYDWNPEYAEYLNHHQKILSMVAGNLYKIEEKYFDVIEIIIFVFSGIGIILVAKEKEINLAKLLLPVTFLGGFLFHIMWETKAIYVLQYYYLLLPFTAYGISWFSNYVVNKFKDISN